VTPYAISDAVRDLHPVLDQAPASAASGEWIATTMQAGVSSMEGGYMDADGGYISLDDSRPEGIVQNVVDKLEAAQAGTFNKVTVRWVKPTLPLMRSQLTVEAVFDEEIVPRGPDDPVYEAVALARRTFWQTRGEVGSGALAEGDDANIHNQTAWFGPHRRVLVIRTSTTLTLATDGLSTPWAGVPTPENGVECELFMEFDAATISDQQVHDWAQSLVEIGDFVADDYQVAKEVEAHGAILFCRLADAHGPMTRVILSRDGSRMEGLPFGLVPLVRVTPITEAEIEGEDQSDEWAARAARHALGKRQIGF